MDDHKIEDIIGSLLIAYTPPTKFYSENHEKMRLKLFNEERERLLFEKTLGKRNGNEIDKDLKNLTARYNERTNRVYSLFYDFFEFKKYLRNFELQEDICFHEIIPGDTRQKMRFDIDIKIENLRNVKEANGNVREANGGLVGVRETNVNERNGNEHVKETNGSMKMTEDDFILGENIKDNLLVSIYNTMKSLGVTLSITTDILIFTSHSDKKISYHIVIDNYYFRDNEQCKEFYNQTIRSVNNPTFIDHAVYSSFQSFRVVGSTKIGQLRVKTFNPTFFFQGQPVIHEFKTKGFYENMVLSHSLISFVHDCQIVRIKVDKIQKNYKDYGDLSDYVIEQIEEKLSTGTFKIRNIEGNLISLLKTETYFCEICNRNHESDNPFLVVENEVVFWCCPRAQRRMYLFDVKTETVVINEEREGNGIGLAFYNLSGCNQNNQCGCESDENDQCCERHIENECHVKKKSKFEMAISKINIIKNQKRRSNYDHVQYNSNINSDENIKCIIPKH